MHKNYCSWTNTLLQCYTWFDGNHGVIRNRRHSFFRELRNYRTTLSQKRSRLTWLVHFWTKS